MGALLLAPRPLADAALPLLRSLPAALVGIEALLLFLETLFLDGERHVVARHQAAVGSAFHGNHIPGADLVFAHLAGAVQLMLFAPLLKSVAATPLDILGVQFHRAPHNLAEILRAQKGTENGESRYQPHILSVA